MTITSVLMRSRYKTIFSTSLQLQRHHQPNISQSHSTLTDYTSSSKPSQHGALQSTDLLQLYHDRVTAGTLRSDPEQLRALYKVGHQLWKLFICLIPYIFESNSPLSGSSIINHSSDRSTTLFDPTRLTLDF